MARPKSDKKTKTLNCKIDVEVQEMLDDYCEKVGQTKTVAVERILKKFLEEDRKNTK